MAKLTVKQLYYGDEYGVMGEVIKSLLQNPPQKVTIDPIAYRELEIVRQTLIAVEKMKKNGDCIAEGELGDAVTVSVSARRRLLKEMFPGVDEKYLEQAFKKIEVSGCPKGEDLMEWFGKLVVAEILADSLHPAKEKENENDR